MLNLRKNTPRWVIMVGDLGLSLMALAFAYLIRFSIQDRFALQEEWAILSKSILVYLAIKFIVFYLFNVHKGLVRHTSMEDLKTITLASLVSSLVIVGGGMIRHFFMDGFYLIPMSILMIEFLASIVLLLGARFAIKLWYLESNKTKTVEERVLIYGAGTSGLLAKRTLTNAERSKRFLVGFVEDNKKMSGNRLEGTPIFHSSNLEKVIKEEGVTQLIIAIQAPNPENESRIVDVCLEHNVEVLKVPDVKSWVNGSFSAKQISKVKIEELLGRNPIALDENKLKSVLHNEVILVTGAAGSIGSGMVEQVARYEPKKLVLLDNAESALYSLDIELRNIFPEIDFEVVIGDIRHDYRMKRLFEKFQPKYVFHAAAYKHVPLMENNPAEAIQTNVLGTKNLVNLADEFAVKKFVMVSTDKAVNPTNVMGASKRIAEMYAQKKNENSETQFITTRFGNVLGSNGSVIPLFQKQIEKGGPITVTDERITRFFMTIPEACQLVLEAGVMGEGGEIFVFDMGESVRIMDLAKKMVKLSGLELGKDIEIKVTGLRPGEKLYEELLAKEENTLPTHHPKILRAKVREENDALLQNIDALIALGEEQQNMNIVAKMKEIVPEFKSNNSKYEQLDKD